MTTGEMDVADAYRLLQIPDRTVDDAAIMAAYTICVDEAPGQAERYYQALSIIAKEKNSSLLSSMIAGPGAESGRDLSEWPVGLQNIGNTCYLNSLLQFCFSIRPFREMVLDFESFRMELDDESLSKKRVGSREVLKKEVERSQTCRCCPVVCTISERLTNSFIRSPERITDAVSKHDHFIKFFCDSSSGVSTFDANKPVQRGSNSAPVDDIYDPTWRTGRDQRHAYHGSPRPATANGRSNSKSNRCRDRDAQT